MALFTGHIRMCARQRELGFVVVKIHIIPTGRIMAKRAIGAVFSIVFIILFMAGVTIGGRSLIHAILMAGLAIYVGMIPFQLER